MLMKELIEKAENIDELHVGEHVDFPNIWGYEVQGNNPDVRKHLKKIMYTICIDDMYQIPNTERWISKTVVDNIIDTIKEATTYDELKCGLENIDENIQRVSVKHNEDIATRIRILIKNSGHDSALSKLLMSKINNIDGCKAYISDFRSFYVESDKINERERCKHDCKTNFKIKKINEIFEL